MTVKKSNQIRFMALIAVLVAAELVWDLVTPNSMDDWVWYFIPVFLSVYVTGRVYSYLLAAVITFLMLFSLHVSPSGIDPHLALVGRLMGISGLWLIAVMIAHYKDADMKRRHLERALRTIGECNRILARAGDEAELLKGICQATVEQGGYRLSWVGFAQQDAQKSVLPAAWAGCDEGYLAKANITWSEQSKGGMGPTGLAIRSGEAVICNDFQHDPRTAPWWAGARQRGFFSSITLPLVSKGRNYGVLVLYADKRNAFPPDEIVLLTALAEDLAHGIYALRAEDKRNQVEAALFASQSQLQFLLTHTPAILYSLRATGDFGTRFISPNVQTLMGYAPEAFLQEPGFWRAHLHPDDAAACLNDFPQLFQTGELEREYRFRHAEGGYRWMHDAMRLVRDDQGQPQQIVGYWLDITARKRVEAEILTARDFHLKLLQNAPALIWRAGTDAKCDWFNQTWLDFTGRALAQELGDGWAEGVHAEDLGPCVKTYLEAFHQREPFDMEYRLRRQDGEYRWLMDCGRPIDSLTGEFAGYIGYCYDITEQKQAQAALLQANATLEKRVTERTAALRASEERLEFAFRAAQDGIWDWNVETNEVFYSARWKSMLGYDEGEIEPHVSAWKRLLHPEDLPQAIQVAEAVLAGNRDYVMEFRMRHKDGHYVDILARGFPVRRGPEGPIIRIVGTHFDLTERKRAEEAIRRSEQDYRQLVETTSEGVWRLDLQATTTFVNRQMAEMLGYTCDEMLGRSLFDFMDEAARAAAEGLFRQRAQGESAQHDFCFRRKDGQPVWGIISGSALRDTHGQVTGIVGFVTDITHRKQVEEELRAYRDHLEQLVRERTRKLELEIAERTAAENSLRASEARLRTISDNLPDSYVYQLARLPDGSTQYLFISRAVEKIHGLTAEAVLNDPSRLFSQVAPEFVASYTAAVEQSRQTLTDLELDIHFQNAGGEWRWLRVRSRPNRRDDGTTVWDGVATDITEQKQVQEALLKREEIFSSIVNQAGEAIGLVDLETLRFVEFNAAAHEMLGYTREEFTGLGPADIDGHMMPEAIRPNVKLIVTQGSALFETQHRHRNGDLREVRINARRIRLQGKDYITALWSDITEARRKETELRKLSLTVEQNPSSVVITDLTGNIEYVNARFTEVTGYPLEEVRGKNPRFLKSGLQPASDYKQLWGDITQGRNWRGELINRKKDGSFHTELVVIAPVKNEHGTLTHFVAMKEDITAAKQGAAALETQRRFLSDLVENSLMQIFVKDREGRYLLVNRAFESLSSCQREEALGRTDVELFGSQDGDRFRQADLAVMASGTSQSLEEERTDEQGRKRTFISTKFPVRNETGEVTGTAGIVLEITERKAAEAQSRRLAMAVEQSGETIVITDTEGKILYANPEFEKSTGYTRAEALGQTPRLLKSGKQAAGYYRDMWKTLESGGKWKGHFINQRKDGTLYEEDATISPIRDGRGTIINYVAVKRDVTNELQLEAQLRQAQKMEAIGTLAGGIAHDFNNILTVIFGYSYMLEHALKKDPTSKTQVEEILKAAHRASDLVQQILAYSRQSEQKREVIRLDPVIKEATKFLRSSLPTNITFEMNFSKDTPAVLAEATQIYQVTMNLATNAMHAMEGRQGQLTVSLDPFTPPAPLLARDARFRPVPYARVTIADTGHGMDAKTRERIFEPFFTTKPVGKGTGLGLAVVHGIIQSHDGIITVESQPEKGTTFSLYFPAQALVEPTVSTNNNDVPQGSGQSILVVDDEEAVAIMLQKLLTMLNYQCTICNRPQQAMALLQNNPAAYDLVITDLTMPEMSGLDLAVEIHALNPKMPVILTTGFKSSLSQEDLNRSAIMELLEKPVTLEKLVKSLHGLLGEN